MTCRIYFKIIHMWVENSWQEMGVSTTREIWNEAGDGGLGFITLISLLLYMLEIFQRGKKVAEIFVKSALVFWMLSFLTSHYLLRDIYYFIS